MNLRGTVEIDEGRKLVAVTLRGPLEVKEMMGFVAEARKEASARNFPILYDMLDAVPGEVSTTDLFWMPRSVPALKETGASRRRVALVYPIAHEPFALFWETTFRNSGLPARAFRSRDEAYAWLGETPR